MSSFWQLGIAHNERRSSALSAFSRMARDLRFAALPGNPASTNLQLIINPPNLGSDYKLPQAAFWQAPVAGDRSRGNMALVGYFVQWVDETNGSPAIWFPSSAGWWRIPTTRCKSLRISSRTPSWPATRRRRRSRTTPGNWRKRAWSLDAAADQQQKPISRDSKSEPFANGEFDSSKGYAVSFTNAVTTRFATALPASLEVALVAVDARTAKRLTGAEKPMARTADMWAT